MTRRRSSPLGLELVLSVVLALVVLPLLSHGAPVQESHDLQKYSEGCYYNYNHYSEGDRILTNEPCLNCTCHNKMLMCYLRVCPFTKPIGHDCTVEKREDQCCPIVTCPQVPVDIAHHSHQLTTSAPGTELSIPEKYGCSIDNKFYVEGAQVPSNPNKPCELCYCIRNRTACLMQECTLHIDGCQPIYNKGSCCPVRYNCDHENELLEIEDFSTTTTTVRPTQGFLLSSTTSPSVSTDCIHDNEVYADGASITGKNSCEHCYCMRGDIVCAVQECEMPTLESGAKTCRALPPAAGECCPSNYVCDDDSVTTEGLAEEMLTTITPIIQSNLHESVSQEDVQLQEHIDDKIPVTEAPEESEEQPGGQKEETAPTTITPISSETSAPSEEEAKDSDVQEDKPLRTTVSPVKETGFDTTLSPIEDSTTHKTEEGFEPSHKDKEEESIHPAKEDEIIDEDKEEQDDSQLTTVSPVVGDIQKADSEDELLLTKTPDSTLEEGTTVRSIDEESHEEEHTIPSKEDDIKHIDVESAPHPDQSTEKEEESTESIVEDTKPEQSTEKDEESVTEMKKPETERESISDDLPEKPTTDANLSTDTATESLLPVTSVPSKEEIENEESDEKKEASTVLPDKIGELDMDSEHVSSSTLASDLESDDVTKAQDTEVTSHTDSASETTEASVPPKSHTGPEETSSESVEFSEESTPSHEESQDKIDEDITEHSLDSSTTSPVYEVITEGANINIGMPEIGDHKTESDLPQKKPKDEPEPIESIPVSPDVTKDEIPQVTESTAEHEDDSSTQKPSTGIDELETIKPSIVKDGEISEESTQSSPEEKPGDEDDSEIPAIVEEITEAPSKPSKPVSGDDVDDEDSQTQTTSLPSDDTHVSEVSESQENEEEPSNQSSDRPTRIHIDGEEESPEITTKAVEQVPGDSTTPESHVVDEDFTEKDEGSGISDETSSVPSVIDSETTNTEETENKDEQGTTVKTPVDDTVSSVESEENKPEKGTEAHAGESLTETPEMAPESATNVPEVLEDVKGKPDSDAEDSSTTIPSIDESEEEHVEHQTEKIENDQEMYSTSAPAIADSEPVSIEEEETTEKTQQDLMDSTTKHPSHVETEETSSQEDVMPGKPQQDSTEVPAVGDYDSTTVTQDTGLGVASTSTPLESKPDTEIDEENIAPVLDSTDSTTVYPLVIESEVPSNEEDMHKPQEHIIPTTAPGSSLSEEETSDAKEPSIEEAETTAPIEDDKPSEQGDSDSTTIIPPIADSSESSEEDQKKHKAPEPESNENVTQQSSAQDISDSTTILPSVDVDVSDEKIKEETDDSLGDSTTLPPHTSESEEPSDEDIKKKTKPEDDDSSTKTPAVIQSETSTSIDEDEEKQEVTTSSPLADSEPSISEEEDKDHEIGTETSTSVPALDSEQPSKETTQESIAGGDLDQSTTSSAHPDKESSESSEDSGIPLHDIVPAAIPGEGDCLANGLTFSNNATVPPSSECELSCTCVNSIIICQKVQCSEPPKSNNCVLDEASSDKCCPQYICTADSLDEDQRPTTPKEIEDEEIQFTTIIPTTRKYPIVFSDAEASTQTPKEEEQIPEEELSHTELPGISDDSTTPLSVDIEQPAITPEDSMSHVKTDEAQETSTKHTDEDSITTTQPITAKPTKQVTGDIEQPIETTSSVPEYSIPSKEPEAVTALGAIDDEDVQKTSTPIYSSETKTPMTAAEENATEASLEKETLQPVMPDATSEAPSVPAVVQTDDSTQSEEAPDTSDETSNESGEETGSEEETKTHKPHEEEDQKLTTSKPMVSEHAGDIEPIDEITMMPEIDYHHPEMPEDLSHTKVEDKTSLEGQKPSKPIESQETDEESDESTEKISTTPASTVLLPVQPHEDDAHKVDSPTGISDKKDDNSSVEHEDEKPHEHKPVKSEDKPIESEEKPVESGEKPVGSGNKPVESDGKPVESEDKPIESEDKPVRSEDKPVGPDGKPIESEDKPIESEDKPVGSEDKPVESDGKPVESEDKPIESEDKPVGSEDKPVETDGKPVESEDKPIESEDKPVGSEDKPVESDGKPVESEDKPIESEDKPVRSEDKPVESGDKPVRSDGKPIESEDTPIESEDKPVESGEKPVGSEDKPVESDGKPVESEDKPIESEGKPVGSEDKPVESEDKPVESGEKPIESGEKPVESEEKPTDSKKDEADSQTSSPVKEELEKDQSTTISPAYDDEEKPVSSTNVPETEDVSSQVSSTVLPSIEGSGADTSEKDSEDDKHDIVSSTSVPSIDQTIAPVASNESNEEDIEISTHAPALESQTESNVKNDETPSQTSTPIIEGQSIEGSGAPISDDKSDIEQPDNEQTSLPAFDEQTPVSGLEEETKTEKPTSGAVDDHAIEGSGLPDFGDKSDQDEKSHTTISTIDKKSQTPEIEEENKTETPTSSISEEDSVEGSGEPISEDKTDVEIDSQTTLPSIEKQPSVSDSHDENKTDVTSSPVVEEESSDIEQDEMVGHTSIPDIERPTPSEEGEENKIDVTSPSSIEDHPVKETDSSASEEKPQDGNVHTDDESPTTLSTIEKKPELDSEEENKTEVTPSQGHQEDSGTPVFEGSGLPTSDEILEDKERETETQTKIPITDSEFIKVTVTPAPEDEEHSVTPSITNTIAPLSETESEPTASVPSSEEQSEEEPTSEEGHTDLPPHGTDHKTPSQTPEKEPHDSIPSSEEGEDNVSGTVVPTAGDKYEETDLPEDKKPISGEEKEESEYTTVSTDTKDDNLDASKAPEESIPTKDMDASDENIESTAAPSKDISPMLSGDEDISATESSTDSSPVKIEDEETLEGDKTTSTDIPTKMVGVEGESLDSTTKPSESIDEDLQATTIPTIDLDKEHSSEKDSPATSEPVSSVTLPASNVDYELPSQTPATVSSDSNASEEEVPDLHTEEQTPEEKQPIDKTLITTEMALPAGETDSEDKEDQSSTDKPLSSTKLPELMSEESSTKAKENSDESINATEMPVIPSHDVHLHPEKPESDDQILVEDSATSRPSSDIVPSKTETSAEDSESTTRIPAAADDVPSHEVHPLPGKPESDDQISTEDVATTKPSSDLVPTQTETHSGEKKPLLEESESTTHIPSAEHEKPHMPESDESIEDAPIKTPEAISEPEIPTTASPVKDVSSEEDKPEDSDSIATGKPIAEADATVKPTEDVLTSESEEENIPKTTTYKPTEEAAPTKSDDIDVSPTDAPVDQQPITSSPIDEHDDSDESSATEKSDEKQEHTEAPKDDTKIQTVGEFVTERAEDLTTALPNEFKDKVPEQPISPEQPETATSVSQEKDEVQKENETDNPEISIATESNLPSVPLDETDEKTQVPEVLTETTSEDKKPQSSEESGETAEDTEDKTQAPETTSDHSDEVHKPEIQETSSAEESDENTQAPEIQPEISEQDHKQHVQPTEGAVTSTSTTDKPLAPTLDEKIDSDLPKPIATDEDLSSEDETPIPTTIHPLFPHIEHDRTTSPPTQLNATDKVDHKLPESSSPSLPTTEQAITNAPTTQYQPPGYGQVPPQYPSYTEDEYTDEDESEVFGPGTCRYGGKLFVSAQQIPRDDPCDFCFCFRSDIICLQQSCPPPISGCHEEPISGFCCPRYECPVSMATTLNITTSTTTTSTTLPPHFLHHAYRGAAAKNGCHISGKSYKVGDKIDSASGPCMHCTCGGDGQMKCDPKTCSPEPMLRQMIAVVASRRR